MLFLLPVSCPYFHINTNTCMKGHLLEMVHIGTFVLLVSFPSWLVQQPVSCDFYFFWIIFKNSLQMINIFLVPELNMVDETVCCQTLQNAVM